jgi:hypothetical protein
VSFSLINYSTICWKMKVIICFFSVPCTLLHTSIQQLVLLVPSPEFFSALPDDSQAGYSITSSAFPCSSERADGSEEDATIPCRAWIVADVSSFPGSAFCVCTKRAIRLIRLGSRGHSPFKLTLLLYIKACFVFLKGFALAEKIFAEL